MRPAPMVVGDEVLKVSIQTALAEYDHVIQALAANGPDHAFDIGVLPWRPRRRKHLFDAHGLHLVDEVLAEDPIPIPEQISRCSVPRKGLAYLLSSPLRRWMRRDCEMHNASAIMRQHQKHVQDLEPDRRHGEEVDRHQILQVIVEESPPGLGRRFSPPNYVLAHAGFADLEAEFEQFSVDPRSTPERIVSAHRTNQLANFLRHAWPPWFPASNLPGPEQAEALAVPAKHRRGADEEDAGAPVLPDGRQPDPQKSISARQFRPLHGPLKNAELMPEGEDLKLKRRRAPE